MMQVYRIGRKQYARDLSGTGAWINGGRWNSKGVYALYTASSASLAMLEWLVHAQTPETKEIFCLTTLELPTKNIVTVTPDQLPLHWQQYPASETLQKFGDNYLIEGKWLAIAYPSVIMPVDKNIVLNPLHESFQEVKIIAVQELVLDERLFALANSSMENSGRP